MPPPELDVPHWARSIVRNYRDELGMSESVTDRMIYARLLECNGMDHQQTSEMVASLTQEVL